MVIIAVECFLVCVVSFKELHILGFLFIFSAPSEFDNTTFQIELCDLERL